MKKKIAILGSTGSIGKSLLTIIKRDKNNIQIKFLSANKNYKELLKQAKFFKVKNVILTDKKTFIKSKTIFRKNNINIYNNYLSINKFVNSKLDYVMSSIIGLEGLMPTIKMIKHTRSIAIANKESIICAWNLIKKELNKHKTNFIPVDSEHFSIWYSLVKNNIKKIDKIFITASGGPLLNYPLNKIKNVKIKKVLKHPNWNMGKKISIDSATMMNKVFEVIEASRIFNIPLKKINILIEPSSYIHAIIKFNDGMTKIIAHDTTMKIPIFNTLYSDQSKQILSKKINIKTLNNLDFNVINKKRFPAIKILSLLKDKNSLFETVLVSANDTLVDLYLKKKINFNEISKKLIKLLKRNEFIKFSKIEADSYETINKLSKYVRLKILSMSV